MSTFYPERRSLSNPAFTLVTICYEGQRKGQKDVSGGRSHSGLLGAERQISCAVLTPLCSATQRANSPWKDALQPAGKHPSVEQPRFRWPHAFGGFTLFVGPTSFVGRIAAGAQIAPYRLASMSTGAFAGTCKTSAS